MQLLNRVGLATQVATEDLAETTRYDPLVVAKLLGLEVDPTLKGHAQAPEALPVIVAGLSSAKTHLLMKQLNASFKGQPIVFLTHAEAKQLEEDFEQKVFKALYELSVQELPSVFPPHGNKRPRSERIPHMKRAGFNRYPGS